MEHILDFVRGSDSLKIVALTGAGISAESGVPTFRGEDGLWETHRAEELATPEAFEVNPTLVWRWYDWRRNLIATVEPNPGHRSLVDLARHPRISLNVVTQNVDSLHQLAGSDDVIELHGNIFELRCTRDGTSRLQRESVKKVPPTCEDCGALLRPGVVWFGEALDNSRLSRAAELVSEADLLLVIGTSAVVYPAAGLATLCPGLSIEVNNAATPFSNAADLVIRSKASEALPAIAAGIITALGGSDADR